MKRNEAEAYVQALVDEAVERLSVVASLESASRRLSGEDNQSVVNQIDEELHGAEVALEAALTQCYKDAMASLNPLEPISDKCRVRTCWSIITGLDTGVPTFYGVNGD